LFFQADYDEIEIQKISHNAILVTSCHYVTEKRHQNNVTNFFPFCLPTKISGYASGMHRVELTVLNKLMCLMQALNWPITFSHNYDAV